MSLGFQSIKNRFTECEINGKRQKYDACSSRSLAEAHKFYSDRYKYIGSGHIWYCDGVKNWSDKITHFYIKK